jgi:hypothetical protein
MTQTEIERGSIRKRRESLIFLQAKGIIYTRRNVEKDGFVQETKSGEKYHTILAVIGNKDHLSSSA